MRHAPLVSFIVPAYNHSRYIGECLDRIAEEPYAHKELVIIDDGSTDDTAAQIERWRDAHAHRLTVHYRSRPNRGLTATLNELVSLAQGTYVRLCASDDRVVPGSLAALVEALEKHPDKSVAFGDARVIDQDGGTVADSALFEHFRGRRERYFSEDGLADEIVRRWSLPGPVALIRKSLYAEIGPYEERLKVEDWDFYLRAVARRRVMFVDCRVADYRIHTHNSFVTLKARDPLASARDHLRVLERTHGLFKGHLRRELDYRLLKQRALVDRLTQHGQPPSKAALLAIRLRSRWQSWRGEVP